MTTLDSGKVLSDLRSIPRIYRIRFLSALLFLLSLILHAPQVLSGLNENNSFRQSQTVMLVREFMRNGLNLQSPIPVFGFNSKVPFEFPIFQYTAAYVGNILDLDPIVASRLLGLIFFELAALMFFVLTHRILGTAPAFISLVIFLFSPFTLMWAASATIEFCAVFFMLFSVNSLFNYSEESDRRRKYLQLALFTVTLLLASLVKITTALVMSSLFLLALNKLIRSDASASAKFRLKSETKVLFFPLFLILLINLRWIQFADSVKSQNRFTALLTSQALADWNYGTLQDRLDVTNSFKIVNTYWGPIIGGVGSFFFFAIIGLFFADRKNSIPILLSLLSGPLVFMNLYAIHDYYSIALYSSIVFLIALGYRSIFSIPSEFFRTKRLILTSIFLTTILLMSAASNYGKDYLYQRFVEPNSFPPLATEIIGQSQPSTNVIYVGCDWNPLVPYYVDRTALMIPPWAPKLSESDLTGFQLLAICGPKSQNSIEILDSIRDLGYNLIEVSENVLRLEKISEIP